MIGAPYAVTAAFLDALGHVDLVAHGSTETTPDVNGRDPYEVCGGRCSGRVVGCLI